MAAVGFDELLDAVGALVSQVEQQEHAAPFEVGEGDGLPVGVAGGEARGRGRFVEARAVLREHVGAVTALFHGLLEGRRERRARRRDARGASGGQARIARVRLGPRDLEGREGLGGLFVAAQCVVRANEAGQGDTVVEDRLEGLLEGLGGQLGAAQLEECFAQEVVAVEGGCRRVVAPGRLLLFGELRQELDALELASLGQGEEGVQLGERQAYEGEDIVHHLRRRTLVVGEGVEHGEGGVDTRLGGLGRGRRGCEVAQSQVRAGLAVVALDLLAGRRLFRPLEQGAVEDRLPALGAQELAQDADANRIAHQRSGTRRV